MKSARITGFCISRIWWLVCCECEQN